MRRRGWSLSKYSAAWLVLASRRTARTSAPRVPARRNRQTAHLAATGDRRGACRSGGADHQCHLASWLKRELEAILQQCPSAPEVVPEGRRWQDWDIYPAAEQLDRFFPPVRVLLILDNLAGHKSYSLVQWCAEHGILLLWTPTAGRLSQHGRVGPTHHQRARPGRSTACRRSDPQAVANLRGPRLESASDAVHLGRQTSCASRPGLRAAAPPGRIRRNHHLRSSSTHPFGSLLQEGSVMPQDLATDPLGKRYRAH